MSGLLHSVIFFYLLLLTISSAFCASDIAPSPINYLISSQVKPNIYFVLDDSGSMQWSYLGDEVVINGYEKTIGYRSYLCNKIYFNPSVNYEVPVKADGSAYPAQDFNAALYDGFKPDSVTVDLAINFTAWRTANSALSTPPNTTTVKYHSDCSTNYGTPCTTNDQSYPNRPEPAYYFVYQGSQPNRLGDGSPEDYCLDSSSSSNWRKIVVGSNSGPGAIDERKNFANWYSYYRTRMLSMKTAVGRAFRDMGSQFRVGFSTIGYSGVNSNNAGFLKISDFDITHKQWFYQKLYAIDPLASTPLRAALSKAGRLYAGKLLNGADDPLRFSC